MKILVYSDLHVEFAEFNPPDVSPDLVILAGNISFRAKGVIWANYAFECPVLYPNECTGFVPDFTFELQA